MQKNLLTLLELVAIGGALALGGCGTEKTTSDSGADTDSMAGCPTTACPTTACPTTSCPTTSCPTTSCPTTSCPTTSCPTASCPTTGHTGSAT